MFNSPVRGTACPSLKYPLLGIHPALDIKEVGEKNKMLKRLKGKTPWTLRVPAVSNRIGAAFNQVCQDPEQCIS